MISLVLFCVIFIELLITDKKISLKLLFVIFLVSAITARVMAHKSLDTASYFCQVYFSLVSLMLVPFLLKKKVKPPP